MRLQPLDSKAHQDQLEYKDLKEVLVLEADLELLE